MERIRRSEFDNTDEQVAVINRIIDELNAVDEYNKAVDKVNAEVDEFNETVMEGDK